MTWRWGAWLPGQESSLLISACVPSTAGALKCGLWMCRGRSGCLRIVQSKGARLIGRLFTRWWRPRRPSAAMLCFCGDFLTFPWAFTLSWILCVVSSIRWRILLWLFWICSTDIFDILLSPCVISFCAYAGFIYFTLSLYTTSIRFIFFNIVDMDKVHHPQFEPGALSLIWTRVLASLTSTACPCRYWPFFPPQPLPLVLSSSDVWAEGDWWLFLQDLEVLWPRLLFPFCLLLPRSV